MYSGFLFNNYSGGFLGVHQKFDSVAYDHLKSVLAGHDLRVIFPSLSMILHFEGRNGPDGLKFKSPGRDEPFHFYDPQEPYKTSLLTCLEDHFNNLKQALVEANLEKAAWEAAWLAHAIVDGLTPAHHYPYEDEHCLMRGENIGQQMTIKDKLLIKSSISTHSSLVNLKKFINNNLNLWGSKGLLMTHCLFELGVAFIVKPFSFDTAMPTDWEQAEFSKQSLTDNFQRFALRINELNMYQSFYDSGWTLDLMRKVRQTLTPLSIKFITLAWHSAIVEAENQLIAYPQLQNQTEHVSVI